MRGPKSSATLIVASCSLIFLLTTRGGSQSAVTQHDDAAAAAAFESLVPALHHPRCMNCHSTGDYPRQGDDGHRHTMQIRRGPDGHGVNAVKCSSCHQDHNLAGIQMPPGAPGWHLPSPAMPMIWEGLSDRQLCELLKDPRQNGNRSVEQIVEHMETPLVLWGWNPGEGHTPIPMPQHEFLARVKEWAARGARLPVRNEALASSSSLKDGGCGVCGIILRKARIHITMLDAHDTEMRILVCCSKDRAISRWGSDIKAFGTRICRIDKRLAAKDHTIVVHENSPTGLRCVVAGTQWLQKYCL
jgi:hypothetical protein